MVATDTLDDEFAAFRNESNVSTEQRVVYFINALIVSMVPIYLYHAIFFMSFDTYVIVYGSVTLFAAIVLTFAYNNIYRIKRLKLSAARDHTITMSKGNKSVVDKKAVYAAKKERQSVVTSHEAIALSIMHNNAIFLISTLVFSFVIFKNVPLVYNYITSVSLAAGVTTFLSTGSKHN
ncbi:translocon-associated protein TRAP gamma subunit [Heterostelium album PN500]|uniref:Translocon-associated protein subunit gamma n=1 Tax=Heterostelium pallidum (strain ATCC 26659 / Pp 5 / PN500) TaxID=670386 RepID=D3B6B4_HETP5|nr:translocon-associated protein TRAP gamma subunit [Heterostelium album PN500]EFA82884.1 translocon-associated protein TRAP gamma subunit [Heterostelium album PN500]|eukprot:XP_020435001.1 translocon-associated protein TRAP gamma subunit [Heterostelium album PN500]